MRAILIGALALGAFLLFGKPTAAQSGSQQTQQSPVSESAQIGSAIASGASTVERVAAASRAEQKNVKTISPEKKIEMGFMSDLSGRAAITPTGNTVLYGTEFYAGAALSGFKNNPFAETVIKPGGSVLTYYDTKARTDIKPPSVSVNKTKTDLVLRTNDEGKKVWVPVKDAAYQESKGFIKPLAPR